MMVKSVVKPAHFLDLSPLLDYGTARLRAVLATLSLRSVEEFRQCPSTQPAH
jgi:hypothetical protein